MHVLICLLSDELPSSLRVLRLAGNPCTADKHLVRDLVANLPKLQVFALRFSFVDDPVRVVQNVDGTEITRELRDRLCAE